MPSGEDPLQPGRFSVSLIQVSSEILALCSRKDCVVCFSSMALKNNPRYVFLFDLILLSQPESNILAGKSMEHRLDNAQKSHFLALTRNQNLEQTNKKKQHTWSLLRTKKCYVHHGILITNAVQKRHLINIRLIKLTEWMNTPPFCGHESLKVKTATPAFACKQSHNDLCTTVHLF